MTNKQNIAMQKVVENGGNVSKAMVDAGYSPKTAENPSKLTDSKAWKEQMEQYLPDEKLLSKHEEALEANRVISSINTGKEASGATSDFIEVPDHAIRLKAVELGYKLKRHLGPEVLQQFNANEMNLEFVGDNES